MRIAIIPKAEFDRIRAAAMDRFARLTLLADMARLNTLATVKRAGSGHLGTSFSSLDIVTYLYEAELNTVRLGAAHPDRDIYFSSKGHDAPGFYAVLHAHGVLPTERFINLRRLGGTHGHPDVSVPGVEANTGSLGMGISKAKGMIVAKRLRKAGGRLFVMTGDGELQEGQIYESLQTAAHQRLTDLIVIVDHNKLQSDKLVSEIIDLGDLEAKFRAFGWHVARCDGHDFTVLERHLTAFRTVLDKPKILIADTIKGRGVSFMEHPQALKDGGGFYRWHAGAPDDASYERAFDELLERINARLQAASLAPVTLDEPPAEAKTPSGVTSEFVAEAFGQALTELAASRPELVVLTGDLAADCKLRGFERAYPDRFIENGIAEQDMVSMAGGLALQGMLPVVNTFANFLAARANEQIYNNACERTKIIYAAHYAGLIPAGPGLSHQSVRDISLFGALPNVTILQPCNAAETRMAADYAVTRCTETCVVRLVIGPSPRLIELPSGYQLQPGRGVTLAEGQDAVLFAYGPVMLHEALGASERLREQGCSLKVVNLPWLNRVDLGWLDETIGDCRAVFVVEDHAPVGGLGDHLRRVLAEAGRLDGRRLAVFGVEGFPACGTPAQALRAHRLDSASLAVRILDAARVADPELAR